VRVLTILGNRPQFVKAAAVSKRLRRRHEEVVVHSGQHYDDELSGVFFRDLSDGNVLVSGEGASFRLWVVDLNRARLGSRVGLFRRLRDLSRPGLNRAEDRELLLESYFAPGAVPPRAARLLKVFRARLVLWDALKRRARPWRRRQRWYPPADKR